MNAFRFRQGRDERVVDLLPPERPTRPRFRHHGPVSGDVVDAEFVTIVEGPRRTFDARRFNDNRPGSGQRRPENWSAVARRTILHAEDSLGRLSNRAFAGLVACFFFVVFMLVGGFSAPALQGSEAPAFSSLDITHVTLTPRDADGMRVLQINAIIENPAPRPLAVPPVRADLIVDGRVVASTLISAPVAEVQAGQSRGLSAKLQHGGGKTPEIRLSFAPADVPRP